MYDKFQSVTSVDNAKYKHVRALLTQPRARKKSGCTVLEGVHLLTSYQQSGCKPKQLWLSQSATNHPEVIPLLDRWRSVPMFVLPDAIYKHLRSIGDGVDALAVIEVPTRTIEPITADALILNDIQDTGNVGTLLRTAAAVGVKHIMTTAGTASCFSPKCLRAGMGAQFSLYIYENVALDALFEHIHTPLLATSSHTEQLIYNIDLSQPVAWVMGNEGQGVVEDVLNKATAVSLPQPNGEESLNVAIAGALCMYEMLRQRQYHSNLPV